MVSREELDALKEELERARTQEPPSEAATKLAIVNPILNQLNWDPRDMLKFRVEEPVGSKKKQGRVDIALCSPRGNKLVLVEVKAPTEKLEDHIEQLMSYAFFEGAKFSVLTNGFNWWLYLPKEDGEPESRCFAKLNLKQDSLDQLVEDFDTFLRYENVASNPSQAEERAKQALRAKLNSESLNNELPRIWRKLLENPTQEIIDIIEDYVYTEIRLRPSGDQISQFLASQTSVQPNLTQNKLYSPVRKKTRRNTPFDKPVAFSLFGKKHLARSWRDVWLGVVEELYNLHPEKFNQVVGSIRGKRSYIEINRDYLRSPRRIKNSNFWAEAHGNSDGLESRSHNLLEFFGYQKTYLKIHLDPSVHL